MAEGSQSTTPPSCSQVGWWSFLTYGWVDPIVGVGVERPVRLEDTPQMPAVDDTVGSTQRLFECLYHHRREGQSHPLLRAVVSAFWVELAWIEVLAIGFWCLGLASPMLLKYVLIFQEAQEPGKDHASLDPNVVKIGMYCIAGLIALNLFNIVANSHMGFYRQRVGIRINSALRGTILLSVLNGERFKGRRSMPQSASEVEEQAPSVYNVISFDVGPNIDIIWIVLGLWIFPFQLFTAMALLFHEVAWAAFPGLMVIIVAKIINGIALYFDGMWRNYQLAAKDRRLGLCDEGFNSIRTVQMLAWTPPMEEQIVAARTEELRMAWIRLWLQKMVMALDYTLGVIVTLVTLGYYVSHTDGELKASVALPVIGLVNSLVGPFGNFPVWMNQYLIWRSAYKRVNDCIGLGVYPDRSAPTHRRVGENDSEASGGSTKPTAVLSGCTLSWASGSGAVTDARSEDVEATQPLLEADAAFRLKELDVSVRGGELLVLVGQEGQGKSSVLKALLGDMFVDSGSIHSPAIAARLSLDPEKMLPSTTQDSKLELDGLEKAPSKSTRLVVPYAAQDVMLFTGSVRSNILFGIPYSSSVYLRVIKACALEDDLHTMPTGDLTEVAQGGATLSGGQRARVGLARAVYRACYLMKERPSDPAPLVLLDDPLCALDRNVARQVRDGLFAAHNGLLASCAVVLATADPWWVMGLRRGDQSFENSLDSQQGAGVRLMVLRNGTIAVEGQPRELVGRDFAELRSLSADESAGPADNSGGGGAEGGALGADRPDEPPPVSYTNPQDDGDSDSVLPVAPVPFIAASKSFDGDTQTELSTKQKGEVKLIRAETREEGHVKWETYSYYLGAVGHGNLVRLSVALTGIMVFQTCCVLLLTYWTSDDKPSTFIYKWSSSVFHHVPTEPQVLLEIYGLFVFCFAISNVLGHGFEIIGGVRAAGSIFKDSLSGTLYRPFRWWDVNATGRVLNRFSEDVNVMDAAVTNIFGIIFGAALYFFGHTLVLAIANPHCLLMLPFIVAGLEYFASFYRTTIRELQRGYLICMGVVYQDMVEIISGKATVVAFDETRSTLNRCVVALDDYQRMNFAKLALGLWIGFRMALIGFVFASFTTLYPVFQYYGYLTPQGAALVGFSIQYSQEVVGIIQQFIMNWSDLEMQLVSIERLREYAAKEEEKVGVEAFPIALSQLARSGGLCLEDVTVTYREGLRPALSGVSLNFGPGEVVAIVGRTGAGKSSLLLSVLQLVPYEGTISIGGIVLKTLPPEQVRRQLVGVVPQQPVIFTGDVRWNLDPYGQWTDEALWDSLKAVGLYSTFVVHQSGLRARLGQGGDIGLSQGQRQQLCAARALLRQPKVAALDEVTASLPPDVAEHTVSTLVRKFKDIDSVVLMITHQSALLSCCERVVKVAAGRIESDASVPRRVAV